jgi:hypothetical protein
LKKTLFKKNLNNFLKFEIFNISENNEINVEAAKVVGYPQTIELSNMR